MQAGSYRVDNANQCNGMCLDTPVNETTIKYLPLVVGRGYPCLDNALAVEQPPTAIPRTTTY